MPTPEPPPAPVPPVPLPEPVAARWEAVYWRPSTYLRGHLTVHGLAFVVIATSMLWQSERYNFRTNRGLAFVLAALTPQQWAVVFLVAAGLQLFSCLAYPKLARPSILLSLGLLSWWAAGFAISWLYAGATILGTVAWALLLGEHFAALTMLDSRRRWREAGAFEAQLDAAHYRWFSRGGG